MIGRTLPRRRMLSPHACAGRSRASFAARGLAGVLFLAASPALAQEDAAPPDAPGRPPAEVRPDSRASQSRSLLREGAFLANEPARMQALETGGWVVVFQPVADREDAGPAMALLPCQTLAQMEQVVEAADEPPALRVSGQVFVYRGRNYFLPTVFAIVTPGRGQDDGSAADAAPDADDQAKPAPDPRAVDQSDDPTVEELIATLQAGDDEAAEGALWVPPPSEARPGLLRDGSYLAGRRGRLQRRPSGVLAFLIENDADVEPGTDPPLVLLPCRALAQIEAVLERSREDLSFTLSGRVFAYGGANYLLPSMYQAHRRTGEGITSAQ